MLHEHRFDPPYAPRPAPAPGAVALIGDASAMLDAHAAVLAAHGGDVRRLGWTPDPARALARAPAAIAVIEMTAHRQERALALIRTRPEATGVIVLADVADEAECVLTLELGADAYVAGPCSPRELLARIRALGRCRAGAGARHALHDAPAVAFGDWRYDPLRRRLTDAGGRGQTLTGAEHGVLTALLAAEGRTVARDAMRVGEFPAHPRSVDMHVSRLRRRLGDGQDAIRTVRGRGYRLVRDRD